MQSISDGRTARCAWHAAGPRVLVIGAAAFAIVVGSSCERHPPAPRNDTALTTVTPPESTPPEIATAPSAWDVAAGPVMLVAGTTSEDGLIVVPSFTDDASLDTAHFQLAGVNGASVDVFARARPVGRATVVSATPPESGRDCGTWPSARLAPAPGTTLPPWTVGFVSGRAEAIPSDSIEGLASSDSTRLAVEVARLASSLPNDTAQAFRGLPFIVRAVRRFDAEPGVEAIVAEVVRRLSVEASPKQEQIFVIAERDSATAGRWMPLHVERASGTEDDLESNDVLAVVRIGPARRPTIVLARDVGDGTSYSLIERTTAPRGWRVRWTSAFAGC